MAGNIPFRIIGRRNIRLPSETEMERLTLGLLTVAGSLLSETREYAEKGIYCAKGGNTEAWRHAEQHGIFDEPGMAHGS